MKPLHPSQRHGFTMIECMVYSAVYLLVMALGFFAFYRCFDHFRSVRQNSGDITRAVRAGQVWRADVRSATGAIEMDPANQTLRLRRGDRAVTYRFAEGRVWRRSSEDASWAILLEKVRHSEMQSEPRSHAQAWRWDLELQTAGKSPRVKPLFTFIAATTAP